MHYTGNLTPQMRILTIAGKNFGNNIFPETCVPLGDGKDLISPQRMRQEPFIALVFFEGSENLTIF